MWYAIQLGQIAGWGIASPAGDHLILQNHGLNREEAHALVAELNRQPARSGPVFVGEAEVSFADTVTATPTAVERRCIICDEPIPGRQQLNRVTCGRPCCIVERLHQLRSLTPAPR